MRTAAALALLAAVAAARPVPDAAALLAAERPDEPPAGEDVPVALSNEAADRIRRILGETEGTLRSPDWAIRVAGRDFSFADKNALLQFLSDLLDAAESRLAARDAAPEGGPPAVSFRAAGFQTLLRCVPGADGTNGPAVVRSRLDPHHAGRDWQPSLVVTVENPAALDPRRLGETVVKGLFDLAVLSEAWARADETGEAPPRRPRPFAPWFSLGFARTLDPAARQDDADAVRAAALRGGLPPLSVVLSALGDGEADDPPLAARLADFWLSFPEPGRRFSALRDRLAGGEEWTGSLYLETGCGLAGVAADEAFAGWIEARESDVLSPGRTTPERVAWTLEAMQLFPGRDGVPADFADSPQPLERLLEPGSREWAPDAARSFRRRLARAAVGRGDAYRDACGLFIGFFDEAARSAPRSGVAIPLLREARAALAASADGVGER